MPKKLRVQRVRFAGVRTPREGQILRRGIEAGVAVTLETLREFHSGKAVGYLQDAALEAMRRDRRG